MSQLPKNSVTGETGLDQLLAEYLRAADAGQAPDTADLLRRHPQWRAELESFFAAQDKVDGWTAPLRELCVSTVNEQRTLAGDEPNLASDLSSGMFGDYELLGEIARGGMGVVYRARHTRLGRVVALKMILAGNLASAADVQRLRSEAQAAARLDHPNIVPIYEVGEHAGRHFFTMRLVEGNNLGQAVGAWGADRREGQRRAAAFLAKAARAVHYAHQHGVLHRDLKPANILLDAKGEPHVTDFGLAKRVGEREDNATLPPALTQTGAILGTPSYMPPEQAGGGQALTTAADTYSLGAILFELLTGRPPFRGDTPIDTVLQVRELDAPRPSSLNAALDYDLETVCLKCLEKDPAKRYESAQALADDLERWLADEPIQARRAGRWERTRKWVRRHPAVAAFWGTAGVAAASLIVLAGFLWHNAELRAEAVHNLGDAKRDLETARTQQSTAQQNVQDLQAAAQTEQAKLDKLQKQAAIERANALTARREADHVVYAANMQFTAAAWDAADLPRLYGLLDRHRPAAGAEDLRGFEWHYLSRLGQRGHRTLSGHVPNPTAGSVLVALAADGKTFASVGADSKIRLWDTVSGKTRQILDGPQRVVSLAFDGDGQRLHLVAIQAGKAEPKNPFNTNLAAFFATWVMHTVDLKDPKKNRAEAFDPNRLAAPVGILHAGEAAVELMAKGFIQPKEGGLFQAFGLARSGDGKTLALAGLLTTTQPPPKDDAVSAPVLQEGAVLLWDLVKNEQRALLKGHGSIIVAAAFAPDGTLATGGFDRTILLWSADGKRQTPLRSQRSQTLSLAWSTDGKRLVAGGADGVITVWNVAAGAVEQVLRGKPEAAASLAFSADGRTVVSGGHDGDVTIWDLPSLAGPTPRDFVATVHDLRFAADGKTLRAADQSGRITTWDPARDDRGTERILLGPKSVTLTTALSPDGQWVAATFLLDEAITIRSTLDGKLRQKIPCKSEVFIEAMAFSADGQLLAWLSGDDEDKPGAVVVSSLETGKELSRFKFAKGAKAVAFAPDGKRLAAGGDDGVVLVGDPATGKTLVRLERGTSIDALAFSRDGSLLAVAALGTISIHHTADGREKLAFPTYSHRVVKILFSPDGRRLATAGGSDERARGSGVKLWDLVAGRETLTLGDSQSAIVSALAFSADGNRLAAAYTEENIINMISGGNKSVVHVWDAGP